MQVMDSVQTVDAGRRSMYDPDEIEEEQRERELRNKVRSACPHTLWVDVSPPLGERADIRWTALVMVRVWCKQARVHTGTPTSQDPCKMPAPVQGTARQAGAGFGTGPSSS